MPETHKHQVTWDEIYERLKLIPKKKCFGIPRGGIYVAAATGMAVNDPEDAEIIVDDLIDSGRTSQVWIERWGKPVYALFDKRKEFQNIWLEFPWERITEMPAEDAVIRILQSIGEDISREGLKETPKRYIKFLNEFLNPQEFNFTMFDSERYDEMIIQKDIPFYSLCEHHLLPFIGTATIAYIPDGKIIGLSKLARITDMFSRRLQNQERLTQQIAEYLNENLKPQGVAITIKARHLCMEMRGIKKHDVYTITNCLKGCFLNNEKSRSEYIKFL